MLRDGTLLADGALRDADSIQEAKEREERKKEMEGTKTASKDKGKGDESQDPETRPKDFNLRNLRSHIKRFENSDEGSTFDECAASVRKWFGLQREKGKKKKSGKKSETDKTRD